MVVYIGMHEENYSKESQFAIFAGMKQFLIAFSARNSDAIRRFIRNAFTEWCRVMSNDRDCYSYSDWFHGSCSVYSVCFDGTAGEIRDMLLNNVADKEYFRLLVTELGHIEGWLERHTWNWLSLARDSVELSNIENPTLIQILEHGGLAPELAECYTVADVDRLLENYREYPEQDVANCRARIISGLQERLRLLNNR